MPTAERKKAIRRARGFTGLPIAGVIIGAILIIGIALSLLEVAYQTIKG